MLEGVVHDGGGSSGPGYPPAPADRGEAGTAGGSPQPWAAVGRHWGNGPDGSAAAGPQFPALPGSPRARPAAASAPRRRPVPALASSLRRAGGGQRSAAPAASPAGPLSGTGTAVPGTRVPAQSPHKQHSPRRRRAARPGSWGLRQERQTRVGAASTSGRGGRAPCP